MSKGDGKVKRHNKHWVIGASIFGWFCVQVCVTSVFAAVEAEGALSKSVYVMPDTVKKWQEQGEEIYFLDVREADEFAAGHLPGAINVVHTEIPAMADRLPKDRPIVTYCIHSAHRAPEAAKALRERGFENAYVLEGGIVAWQAGGFTLRAADLAKKPTILPYSDRCASGKKAS